jgi:hypothetical protein
MRIRSTLPALLAIVSSLAAGAAAAPRGDDREAVRLFLQAVEDYLATRRQLDALAPPPVVSDDPQSIRAASRARRAAIAAARTGATAGAIFNADAAALFRRRVAQQLAGRPQDVAALLTEMTEHGERWQRAAVNAPFIWTTAAATPPSLLAVLPALPPGLQYRFVGPDLVLVDADAGLVLDVIAGVLADLTGRRDF